MLKKILNQLEEGIISLLLVAMTIEVFVEVIMRYVFNTGLLWGTELTLLLSAWMVLFGASYGVKVGSHIGVDAVTRLLSPTARRVVSFISVVLALCYCGLVLVGSWTYLEKMYEIGLELQDIPAPRWVAHSGLIVGYVMLSMRLLQLLYKIAIGKAEGFTLMDEAKEGLKMFVEQDESGNGKGVAKS